MQVDVPAGRWHAEFEIPMEIQSLLKNAPLVTSGDDLLQISWLGHR